MGFFVAMDHNVANLTLRLQNYKAAASICWSWEAGLSGPESPVMRRCGD